MEHEAWPTPQTPAREPLPRVEDLPVADQGYEPESVRAAFDSFYRHAAQLDAALRTLEAVDSFHRSAASLRADLRSLRAAGWTQQSWTQPPSYGYGMRAPREGVPPAVWRIGGEVAFLVVVAVALGVAQLSWWAILAAMAGAFAIVCLIEWLAGREQMSFVRPAGAASPGVHPVVEAQRAEDTNEHDSLGWTAFEEAQEPSDAMTIIGEPSRDDLVAESPEPGSAVIEPEPEPDPEPELPPAAEVNEPEGRRWWRRRRDGDQPAPEPDLPRHVRLLSPDDAVPAADPWEEGFDGRPGESVLDEGDADEPVFVEERKPGHSRPG